MSRIDSACEKYCLHAQVSHKDRWYIYTAHHRKDFIFANRSSPHYVMNGKRTDNCDAGRDEGAFQKFHRRKKTTRNKAYVSSVTREHWQKKVAHRSVHRLQRYIQMAGCWSSLRRANHVCGSHLLCSREWNSITKQLLCVALLSNSLLLFVRLSYMKVKQNSDGLSLIYRLMWLDSFHHKNALRTRLHCKYTRRASQWHINDISSSHNEHSQHSIESSQEHISHKSCVLFLFSPGFSSLAGI